MSNVGLTGIQLAAALAEEIYRRKRINRSSVLFPECALTDLWTSRGVQAVAA